MQIHRIVNSVFTSNTYILEKYGNESVFLIDIGDIQPIMHFVERRKTRVKGVFITHTHYDHIYGIRKLMELFPDCIIYTSAFGKEALGTDKLNFSRYHEDPIEIINGNITILHEGDQIELFSGKRMEAFETPGHDKSCLTYQCETNIFSGDSYIPGLKVIASFPNSNKMEAGCSRQRIKMMSIEKNLYPGHGNTYECFQLEKSR